mmetsp:Transcript_13845/g.43749  ORF Transcript_13845/g.43749 Transcript_13845/m.43749 type:complete len:387 (+) Transcript_13845:284-1444(+)
MFERGRGGSYVCLSGAVLRRGTRSVTARGRRPLGRPPLRRGGQLWHGLGRPGLDGRESGLGFWVGKRAEALEANGGEEAPGGVVPYAAEELWIVVLRDVGDAGVGARLDVHVVEDGGDVDVEGVVRVDDGREAAGDRVDLAGDGVEPRRVDELDRLGRRPERRRGRADGEPLVVRVADRYDLAREGVVAVARGEEGLGHVREGGRLPADRAAGVDALVLPRRDDVDPREERDDAMEESGARELHPLLVGVGDDDDRAAERLEAPQQVRDALLDAPQDQEVALRHGVAVRRDPTRRAQRVVPVQDAQPRRRGRLDAQRRRDLGLGSVRLPHTRRRRRLAFHRAHARARRARSPSPHRDRGGRRVKTASTLPPKRPHCVCFLGMACLK